VGGWQRAARRAARSTLSIGPGEFARARFEHQGTWDQTALFHFYGAGAGQVDYRFVGPNAPLERLTIRARLSSEWPGTHAPPDGGSKVALVIDRQEVAALDAVADDGLGTVHEVAVSDRALMGRLSRGAHTLSLVVPDRPGQHGLCVYGAATGKRPLPDGVAAIPIQLEAILAEPASRRPPPLERTAAR
jgi:hypothetical protein